MSSFGNVSINDLPAHLQEKARQLAQSGNVVARHTPESRPAIQPQLSPLPMGVRVVTLPWSVLVSDNEKHTPAKRGDRLIQPLTDAYATAKARARAIAAEQLAGLPPLAGSLALVATLYEPNRAQHRDVHNYGKLVCDVLKGLAYVDDWMIDDDRWLRGVPDVDAPRLELTITLRDQPTPSAPKR